MGARGRALSNVAFRRPCAGGSAVTRANSASRAARREAALSPGLGLAARLESDFWSNLKPKPSDNQNPFEPLMQSFAARRDQVGSPPQNNNMVTRGGWPAGGKYHKQTGTWASDDDAPPSGMPGRAPKYNWTHQQFVRPSPQANF